MTHTEPEEPRAPPVKEQSGRGLLIFLIVMILGLALLIGTQMLMQK